MQMDLTLKGGHRAGVCDWLSYYLNSWNCWAAGLCMTEACESPWHLVGFSARPSIGFSANTVSLIKLKQQAWAEQLLGGFSSSRDQGRSVTPRSRVPQRPPRSLNLYAKTKSLYFKLELSLCLMQWWEQREPWGRIFFFYHSLSGWGWEDFQGSGSSLTDICLGVSWQKRNRCVLGSGTSGNLI